MNSVKIKESDIIAAAQESPKSFYELFVNAYRDVVKDGMTVESMSRLNSEQHTVLAYSILIEELIEEGFVGAIQNGYGGYFFENPFARELKAMGLRHTGSLLYDAKRIYNQNKEELEADKSDEDFIASFEKFEEFDDIEERIVEDHDDDVVVLATYIDEHIDLFADVVK